MKASVRKPRQKHLNAVIRLIAGLTALVIASKEFVHEVKDAMKLLSEGAKIGIVNDANQNK